MTTTPPPSSELFTIFGRTNGYLLTEETAHDAVDGLATVARDIISSAQGAGVSLMSPDGKRLSVGATDGHVLEADNLQYEFGEGPCIAAWSTGAPVVIADTHADERWPQWTAAAAASGIRSCLSVPLMHNQAGLGAMKVYSDQADAFSEVDRELLTNLARSAAALLGHVQANDTPQRISNHVKASLANRDTIGIARGILMERLHLNKQAAMDHLIDLATDARTTIGSIAAHVVERQDGSHNATGA
ncbi:GAF domain-containing protein [Vibrio cholerae]|nr:GAF domain-containing protein [Vibrio cholerae]